MRKLFLSLVAGLALTITQVWAEDVNPNDPYVALTQIVSKLDKHITDKECSIAASIDYTQYQHKLDVFREAWLNRDFSHDFYAQRGKQVLSYIVLKHVAEFITEGLYNGQRQPECSFSINISYPDKFGQQTQIDGATWRFNNEQAGKVNWEHFDPKQFNEIALDYKLNPALTEWVSDEATLGDKKPAPPVDECDMLLFNANAIFIRATTFCKKDYMDSKAGYAALAGARKCSMSEQEMKEKAGSAMLSLDRIARQHGRAAVCPFVEEVARQVDAAMH